MRRRTLILTALVGAASTFGCQRSRDAPGKVAAHPSVASLVPAATDLICAMHAADHLIAVSNFEPTSSPAGNLPKVGDYQQTDWEKLTELRPDVMIIFMDPQRVPAGLTERARQLHIQLINVHMDRLNDVFSTISMLGQALNESAQAASLAEKLHTQLDAVKRKGGDPVKALLSLGSNDFDLVAGDTYLDDLLTIAGGENLEKSSVVSYPTVDRERMLGLAPQVVIQLAPDASPQWKANAEQLWNSVPTLPAVKSHRVEIIDDSYALQPGSHVGELAEKMFKLLHRP